MFLTNVFNSLKSGFHSATQFIDDDIVHPIGSALDTIVVKPVKAIYDTETHVLKNALDVQRNISDTIKGVTDSVSHNSSKITDGTINFGLNLEKGLGGVLGNAPLLLIGGGVVALYIITKK